MNTTNLQWLVNRANAAAGTPSAKASTADFQRALEGLAANGNADAAKVATGSDRTFATFVKACKRSDWRAL